MNTGIILLGGKGLRISPQSKFVNKHMNMIYDKPIFFYSITALILSGIDKLVISCNNTDRDIFDNYSNLYPINHHHKQTQAILLLENKYQISN